MTNQEVIAALKEVKTYCAPSLLDPIDYAVHVFERIDRAGVKDAVHADYTAVAAAQKSSGREN